MLTLEGLSGGFWMTSLLVLPPGERLSLVWKDSKLSCRLLSDFLARRTQPSGSLCFVVMSGLGLGLCLSWHSLFLKSMNLMMTDEEKSTVSHSNHSLLCLTCNSSFTLSGIWKDQEDFIYHLCSLHKHLFKPTSSEVFVLDVPNNNSNLWWKVTIRVVWHHYEWQLLTELSSLLF